MKTYLFSLLVVVCSVSASGQELSMDSTTGKWMYRQVVTMDSMSAGDLYDLARAWMARAYMSANDVIQYENRDEGKLIGRGVWKEAYTLNDEKMEHIIIIECRDGRLRYTFTDFVRETYDSTLGRQRKALEAITFMKKSARERVATTAAKTGEELEKSLKSEPKGKDDGW